MTFAATEKPRRPGAVTLSVVALWLAAVLYLALSALDAKSAAVLSGSLSPFGISQALLDGLPVIGFAIAAIAGGRGRGAGRWLGILVCGAALWRGLDAVLDAGNAAANDDLKYWRIGQEATTGVLVLAGVVALVAAIGLARKASNAWFAAAQ
ncbi:MAG TPA: hypothetical protein VE172_22570 [Stackebrandtia sp.]|uniref:hypothetical protein n=1 Tax=Stackebrandtia sp. TaxID=2023065 RepID=UPI002D4F6E94|nr:hypothetical protein [Stackebrandtia sp.]HZE41594.1 hypothetical protein [Stackebrandtia sp.]